MAINNESTSQDQSKCTNHLKKRSENEFFDMMITEPNFIEQPGQNSLYLYSGTYQTIEKLISKCGQYLNLTEGEYFSEFKNLIPEDLQNKDKNKSNFPLISNNQEKDGINSSKRIAGFKKHHHMNLRNRQLQFDKENFV